MSILSQVLGKFPALISIAFPGLWKEMLDPSNTWKKTLSWSISDLRSALRKVAHNHDAQARGDVCLFIDGFDEYNGDHAEIADILNSLIVIRPTTIAIQGVSRKSSPDGIRSLLQEPSRTPPPRLDRS